LAITQLERAIQEMEKNGEDAIANVEAAKQVDDLLRKIKGEPS
jgi:hypothetical protein